MGKKAADNPRPSIDACLKIANGYYGEMDELLEQEMLYYLVVLY